MICHQMAERSFDVAGMQMAVCARCTGIYAGITAGAMLAAVGMVSGRPAGWIGRSRGVSSRQALIAVAVPTAATLAIEWAGVWDPRNGVRALAGAILGAGVALVVLTLHYDECVLRRPTVPHRPATRI
jgi:uncharacterized membrane protein